MEGINWANVVLVAFVIQVFLMPILWRDFIPLKKSTLKIMRIASFILLGPVYLFLAGLLRPTSAEGSMIAVLAGLGVVPQGIVLSMLYKRKRTKKVEKALPTMAKFIGYALMTLILILLGVYFLVYLHSLIIGLIFCALGICSAIIIIIKEDY